MQSVFLVKIDLLQTAQRNNGGLYFSADIIAGAEGITRLKFYKKKIRRIVLLQHKSPQNILLYNHYIIAIEKNQVFFVFFLIFFLELTIIPLS